MFSHMMVGSQRHRPFEDLLRRDCSARWAASPASQDDKGRLIYVHNGGIFIVTKPIDGEPRDAGQWLHDRLRDGRPKQADAWHAAGVATAAPRSRIRRACAKAASASSISPICAIPTATNCARCTASRLSLMTLEIVSTNKAHGGTQGVYATPPPRPAPTMTFSVFVPPQAEAGEKLPVVWYLSGLTCTHANVTEKGEYRRGLRRTSA